MKTVTHKEKGRLASLCCSAWLASEFTNMANTYHQNQYRRSRSQRRSGKNRALTPLPGNVIIVRSLEELKPHLWEFSQLETAPSAHKVARSKSSEPLKQSHRAKPRKSKLREGQTATCNKVGARASAAPSREHSGDHSQRKSYLANVPGQPRPRRARGVRKHDT